MEEIIFQLDRDNIVNLMSGQVRGLIDAYSLREDEIVFSKYLKEKERCPATNRETSEFLNKDMDDIKSKWLKYVRLVFEDLTDYSFEYHHPYKSGKLQYVCEVSVYIDGEYNYGKQFASKSQAEMQAYLGVISGGNIMSVERLVERINDILAGELITYNDIYKDNVKFIVSQHRTLGATCDEGYPHNISNFLFAALSEPRVLRSGKIERLFK